ncbi:MAG: hypothetical protein RLZZ324_329 [Candidatus Parcubacteria bacterium]|jgi:MFS family permease
MRTIEKNLLYGANIWYLAEGMLGPLMAVFAQRVGGDILEITWAWAAYLVMTGVGTIAVGRLSDRHFSKKKLMIAGYALNAAFTFSYLLVDSPGKLFIAQIGLGLAAALANPTWSALYAEYETKKDAGFIWGLASGQGNITNGVAILLGGAIVSMTSFPVLFMIMGTIQVIATLFQARILKIAAR